MKTRKILWAVDITLAIIFAAILGAIYILVIRPRQTQELLLPAVITAQAGSVTVKAETPAVHTPETVWTDTAAWAAGDYTMPQATALDGEGCIGIVTVPSVGIQMNVYETDDAMEDMKKGAAHFKSTSAWEGNVGLSGHNFKNQFGPLTRVSLGDTIAYQTALGTRYYSVSKIETIDDEDWSYLDRTEDNRITLITCIVGQDDKRLMVQATEF